MTVPGAPTRALSEQTAASAAARGCAGCAGCAVLLSTSAQLCKGHRQTCRQTDVQGKPLGTKPEGNGHTSHYSDKNHQGLSHLFEKNIQFLLGSLDRNCVTFPSSACEYVSIVK